MSEFKLENSPQNNSLGLIQKAMRFAVNRVMNKFLDKYPPGYNSEPKLGYFLRDMTENKCRTSSALSILYIREQYHDLFPTLFLLEGSLGNDRFIRSDWLKHIYAIFQDNEQNWYGCSPANWGIDGPNPLVTIMQAENLDDLINNIKNLEGGMWPQATKISELIPKLSPKEIYEIDADNQGNLHLTPFQFNNEDIQVAQKFGKTIDKAIIEKLIKKFKS